MSVSHAENVALFACVNLEMSIEHSEISTQEERKRALLFSSTVVASVKPEDATEARGIGRPEAPRKFDRKIRKDPCRPVIKAEPTGRT